MSFYSANHPTTSPSSRVVQGSTGARTLKEKKGLKDGLLEYIVVDYLPNVPISSKGNIGK